MIDLMISPATIAADERCRAVEHAALRSSRARWAKGTRAIGVQLNERRVPVLELANCKACGSTLSRPVPRV